MKNNKGFTLVELLAVIVVLALLITIAVPGAIGISNKLKVNMYCSKIDLIETQAKIYGEDRRDSFTGNYTTSDGTYKSKTIKVIDLVNSGDLKKDNDTAPYIVDPRDDSGMDDMSFILYIKYNRIYVSFDENIKNTCDK